MKLVNTDRFLGVTIFIVCIVLSVTYAVALFSPFFEAIRIWLIAIPVFIGLTIILAIGAWVGWTIATTPSSKSLKGSLAERKEERSK